jgi:nascent polypeptide-associated complex subunit alpha
VEEEPLLIPEEDVHLVAQQAGVDVEAARKALEAAEGDLAQAILNLTQTR